MFIADNIIRDIGAINISEYLKTNKSLTILNLSNYICHNILFIGNNNIGFDGSISIAGSLRINRTLSQLILCILLI